MPTVLLVDDDRDLARVTARRLAARGWEVRVEHDGLRALQQLEEERVDVVIADERMPGPGGALLLETVHRAWPGVRLVMLSGAPSPSGRERVAALGGVTLDKAATLGELLEALGG